MVSTYSFIDVITLYMIWTCFNRRLNLHKFKGFVRILLGLVLILVPVAYFIYITFTNIDMTRVRLLVTYWKEYLMGSIPIALGMYLLSKDSFI